MTAAVTPWLSVKTPPLADRPGVYEVQAGGERGPIRKHRWDGMRWDDPHVNATFGDRWRGCAQPAED